MFASHLECGRCSSQYSPAEQHHLCHCGGPLLVRYNLHALKESLSREELSRRRDQSLWRFREFLPVKEAKNRITLGEGGTPLLPLPALGEALQADDLYLKDEGLNPTGSFKARGAAVGVAVAKELGVETIAMPTAGNAGGAWAAYCSRAGLNSVVVMPADAPEINKKETAICGSQAYLVEGLISDAGKIIAAAVKKHGWYDASTLKEPYRIEGKKTMGLEIAEQLDWELPAAVLYPAGGGVGLIGIWKALHELQEIGWIQGPLPKLIAVQAEGCSPLVKAYQEGREESEFFVGAQTAAAGLRVPKALGDFLVLRAVRETGGCIVSVSDAEMAAAMGQTARSEGLFICPEGAALVAALQKLLEERFLHRNERIILLNTGSGMKYPEFVTPDLPLLAPGTQL